MKPRKVKGLDPGGEFAWNARRMLAVRLDELWGFAEEARRRDAAEAQHDMRVAAKRVRYVLEVTRPCFGKGAAEGIAAMRELQDLLGELHDCDVLLAAASSHVERLLEEDATFLAGQVPAGTDLDPSTISRAPNRERYAGLEALAIQIRARRGLLHARFVETLDRLDEERFPALMEALTADPHFPAPAPAS